MSVTEKSLKEFQSVTRTVKIPGVNLRDPSGGKVRPSGLVICNTEASDGIVAASEEKFKDLHKAGIQWLVNLANKEVAGRLVALDTPGATPIRAVAGGTFTLYMHNVFAEYPSLRPSSEMSVPVTVHKDADGPFFVFHLNMAVTPARGGHRAAPALVQDASVEAVPAGASMKG